MKELTIEIPNGYEIDKENSTFEKIIFKPLNPYPKTWEECIKKFSSKDTYLFWIGYFSDISPIESLNVKLNFENYNLLPSKEIAEKFLVLQKLYTCRQAYIGDWKPDWTDCFTVKWAIKVEENKIFVDGYYKVSRNFSFPSLEMAQEFLKNFKSDLEFVKDLL